MFRSPARFPPLAKLVVAPQSADMTAAGLQAEIELGSAELRGDVAFFASALGMRLERIAPADDPRMAVFAGHGVRVRLVAGSAPGTLHLMLDGGTAPALPPASPGGTILSVAPLHPPLGVPVTAHAYGVRRLADDAPWVIGRAGMHYRDLIPDRLGGSIIASHIRIPDGGPVPDMVHYHAVGFQLIFCHRGWVDLVYEDQGPPFRLHARNCVTQPPRIRHRVLRASPDIEVIEIGVPAEHLTTVDHEMTLPTVRHRPDRDFDGQRFVHHRAEDADWRPFRVPGYTARDTTIADHTGGIAGVHVARRAKGAPAWAVHDADILFGFVRAGTMTLHAEGHAETALHEGDAFVTPPGLPTLYGDPSADIDLLEVTLPGRVATRIVAAP